MNPETRRLTTTTTSGRFKIALYYHCEQTNHTEIQRIIGDEVTITRTTNWQGKEKSRQHLSCSTNELHTLAKALDTLANTFIIQPEKHPTNEEKHLSFKGQRGKPIKTVDQEPFQITIYQFTPRQSHDHSSVGHSDRSYYRARIRHTTCNRRTYALRQRTLWCGTEELQELNSTITALLQSE